MIKLNNVSQRTRISRRIKIVWPCSPSSIQSVLSDFIGKEPPAHYLSPFRFRLPFSSIHSLGWTSSSPPLQVPSEIPHRLPLKHKWIFHLVTRWFFFHNYSPSFAYLIYWCFSKADEFQIFTSGCFLCVLAYQIPILFWGGDLSYAQTNKQTNRKKANKHYNPPR